ncbi:DegT/DnrJ/EryC1/StrS family aminotransferase [Larkinella harenae]
MGTYSGVDDTIQMVDLKKQYLRNKVAIDTAMQRCVDDATFINGPQVGQFEQALSGYLGVQRVISCANGTDALQLAMMALNLKPGDEVIVPAFTYVATAEVIALLGLVPVMVDVDPVTFTIAVQEIEKAVSKKTRAVVPVHLFGQCADMESILKICQYNDLVVIEDTAQAIGTQYTFSHGEVRSAGCLGNVGTTSFFPSKNLGCFGDGGAVFTNDPAVADRVRQIANHGQSQKYKHDVVGINSRLDTLQAAVLLEKLNYLDAYTAARQRAATWYDQAFEDVSAIELPGRVPYSTHVFHQYTLKVPARDRDRLRAFLLEKHIPSMVYYPISLAKQKAYQGVGRVIGDLAVTEELCQRVVSLPIHTELSELQLDYICHTVKQYFNIKKYTN